MNKTSPFFFLLIPIIFVFSISGLNANQESDKMTIRRFAFIIGANNGGPGRLKLRYAVTDAKSIKNVLEEMGGVLPDDTRFLIEPDRKALFKAIKNLSEKINRIRLDSRRIEVIFYYSGHSDEESILLGSDRVSYKDFRKKINRINADVRIAILDSCASGAFNLLKGVTKKSPFLMDTAYDMRGFAFMTSSSSHEASQESGRLKGSFFTHHLISGMRGAADMSQDGIITLNEAYQYAYKETLSQTEKTIGGPQHPSYNIQMSGKGDVIMTDIRKSSAILVIAKKIFGRVFIHNQENVLIVEMNKPYGRTIEIGLEKGRYRLINIREGNIYESMVTLSEGMRLNLNIDHFKKTDKINAQARGNVAVISLPVGLEKIKKRFQVELLGGLSNLNPADLNLRVHHDEKISKFCNDDYFTFEKNIGNIASYSKNREGEYQTIKQAAFFGFRFKYILNKWMAVSLGFEYLSKNQSFRVKNQHIVTENSGLQYIYDEEISSYILSIKGLIPTLGIHFGKKIIGSMKFEGFITSGPLFARCGYFINYQSAPLSIEGILLDRSEWRAGELEEKGKGTGFALDGGARINIDIKKFFGIFLEGGYAYHVVKNLSGSGSHNYEYVPETWQGEWGIKKTNIERSWGNIYSLFPSNYWEGNHGLKKIRNFKLDLSGFRLRMGIFYRF